MTNKAMKIRRKGVCSVPTVGSCHHHSNHRVVPARRRPETTRPGRGNLPGRVDIQRAGVQPRAPAALSLAFLDGFAFLPALTGFAFLPALEGLALWRSAAWAAARRATGTRNGEQLT